MRGRLSEESILSILDDGVYASVTGYHRAMGRYHLYPRSPGGKYAPQRKQDAQ